LAAHGRIPVADLNDSKGSRESGIGF